MSTCDGPAFSLCILSLGYSSSPSGLGLATYRSGCLTDFSAQEAAVCIFWEKYDGEMEMSCLHELLGGHVEQNNKKPVAFQPAHALGCSQSEISDGLLFCSSMAPKMKIQKTGLAWTDSVCQGRQRISSTQGDRWDSGTSQCLLCCKVRPCYMIMVVVT